MQTREEAIAWLNAQGLHARAHDGFLGEAIAAASRVELVPGIEAAGGAASTITLLHDHVFIHPQAGEWLVTEFKFSKQGRVSVAYPSLEAAMHATAAALIARREAHS